MSSFSKLATETASTKRAPTISGGKRGEATTNVVSLSCFPLDPVDPDLKQRMGLDTPHELLQTYVAGNPDILEGDVLVYGGADYPIRSCAQWKWRPGSDTYLHLVLEDLKS